MTTFVPDLEVAARVQDILDDSNLTIPVIGDSVLHNPADGSLTFDNASGKVLVYDGSGSGEWKDLEPNAPRWEEVYFAFEVDGETIGIWNGVLDMGNPQTFTIYEPDKTPKFRSLRTKELHPMDYDTHVEFKTLPIMKEMRSAPGGILLKFPD